MSNLSYRELQSTLKQYRNVYRLTCKLTAPKAVLEAELVRVAAVHEAKKAKEMEYYESTITPAPYTYEGSFDDMFQDSESDNDDGTDVAPSEPVGPVAPAVSDPWDNEVEVVTAAVTVHPVEATVYLLAPAREPMEAISTLTVVKPMLYVLALMLYLSYEAVVLVVNIMRYAYHSLPELSSTNAQSSNVGVHTRDRDYCQGAILTA